MQFNVKEWREIYNEVKLVGQRLKESRRRYDKDNKNWIPALKPLPEAEQKVLEAWIDNLLLQNNLYLDACGMRAKEPLWIFNIDDTKTWPSHQDFIYGHLLKGAKVNVL